ncbi:PadR family transcriptional regulator [Agromyces allii]|uniref:Transcription regulator PadR N-terminal domain-containing protein n=2 Tax=Agromyces allii TaxID=393607 RepID=A0ABP5BXR6_9MICO
MAVRDAVLALLTMGPAYGFALHGGLAERTGGRRTVNVGQTYATIERLTKQRLVEPAGTTDDGLPLHRLTEAGRLAAEAWLAGADAAGADPWDETVDRVLVAASLPGVDAASVVDAEARRWRERRDLARGQAADSGPVADGEPAAAAGTEPTRSTPATAPGAAAMAGLARLAASADLARAEGALAWLADAGPIVEHGGLAFEPNATRPRRGRRPGRAATPLVEAPAVEGAATPAQA